MNGFIWIKAFHIISIICWFACVFYLPRLFINYVITDNADTRQQLVVMMRKLFRFSIPFALLTIVFGVVLFGYSADYYAGALWFQIKVVLVLLFVVYHIICGRMVGQFTRGENLRSHVFYRVFNELPVLFILFPVVILAVVKPF